MDLLRNEITYELTLVGRDKFPEVDSLAIMKFDSTVYQKARHFLVTLKESYGIRSQNAIEAKEKAILQLTNSPEKEIAFENFKLKYQNEAVIKTVENANGIVRIAEWEGALIQKIYPIYFNGHRPEHTVDFRENFYVPQKYFWGIKWDTLYFNIAIIWAMSLFLYVTLYFELLKKLVHSFELRRRYKRK